MCDRVSPSVLDMMAEHLVAAVASGADQAKHVAEGAQVSHALEVVAGQQTAE